MIRIRTDPDAFGVSAVIGLDPPSPGEHAAALQDVLALHAFLVLRMSRPLEDDELQSIASLFGPIKEPIARTSTGDPLRYSERRQIIDSGFVMTDEVREKLGDLRFGGLDDDRPGLFETFHCDDTHTAEPARVTVLDARPRAQPTCSRTCHTLSCGRIRRPEHAR